MADTTTAHLGRKISRLRELRGMKQETLAEELGISQQAVSKIEQSEQVDEVTLDRIAKVLGFTKEAIMRYNEESIINLIQNNTYNDNSSSLAGPAAFSTNNMSCTFNPLDKYVEAVAKNEQLYTELLKSEREKIALLEKVIAKLEGK